MIKKRNRGGKIENIVFVERWRKTIGRIKNAEEEQRRPNILMINELEKKAHGRNGAKMKVLRQRKGT